MELADNTLLLAAKRALQAQLLLFALGIMLVFLFPAKDSNSIPYYFVAWFFAFATLNIGLIVLMLVKKPEGYAGYALALLLFPPTFGITGFLFVMFTSGITC